MNILASTSANCRSEDVSVLSIVVAKLELSNVQRQILVADLVEAPHDATLNQRPEALDCVGVDDSGNAVFVLLRHISRAHQRCD